MVTKLLEGGGHIQIEVCLSQSRILAMIPEITWLSILTKLTSCWMHSECPSKSVYPVTLSHAFSHWKYLLYAPINKEYLTYITIKATVRNIRLLGMSCLLLD